MRTPSLCLALATSILFGQGSELLTLESIAHPTKKVAFVGTPASQWEWLKDGTLVETRREQGKVSTSTVESATWAKKPLVDPEGVRAALVAAGVADAGAKEALAKAAFTWNPARSAFLVKVAEDLYLVEVAGNKARRLTPNPGKKDEPTFSPDGTQVAFLRGNDLYRVELATGKETRLTLGGSDTQYNGRLDWVYQEEVFQVRGDFRAYWWSPDSKRIAFLSLDESKVPLFTLMDDRQTLQKAVQARYPRAGEPNPVARLGVVDLDGRTLWPTDPYPGQETLIVQVGWDPLGRLLAHFQDRIQTWLDFRRFEGTTSQVLIHEEGKAWQERLPLPHYLPDGGFIWESERTGHHHLYRYGKDGQPLSVVTGGDWDVRQFHGTDGKNRVYFDATERSPIGQDAYRIGLDGQGQTRLTKRPGTHRVRFNEGFTAFVDTWSDISTPPQQSLHDGSGTLLRVIDANPSERLKTLKLGKVTFQQVKTRDGFPMETMLVYPADFDRAKKYPVFQYIYGGPAAPMVHDAWSRDMDWFQFLAQQGIATWICDNRSASAKGLVSAWGIHRNMGGLELQDQLDGLAWLKGQGWADMDRICLDGWSYGGYMTTYALTHSKAWKLGIAGAPVVDWSLYDSIYTERYMGLPADNKLGYEASSVLKAAGSLHGKLLILHGTLDDNVHPQNTVALLDALQKANLPTPPVILLPGSDHSPRAPQHRWARYQAMWDFIKTNL